MYSPRSPGARGTEGLWPSISADILPSSAAFSGLSARHLRYRRPTAAALVLVCALLAIGIAVAVPWHVHELRRGEAEARAEALRQSDTAGRAHLRAECEKRLGEGRQALMRRDTQALEEARLRFAAVLQRIDHRSAQECPALRALQAEAQQLLADAERLSAATALRISLVTEIAPTHERLWERAQELARQIATRHPVAVQGSIRAIWEAQGMPRAQALSNALRYIQVGKPIATEIKPSSTKGGEWTLR